MWVGFWGEWGPWKHNGVGRGARLPPSFPFGFSLKFWDRVGLTTGFCFYADYQFVWLLDSWRIWKGLSYSDDLIIVIPWFLQNCLSLAFWLHTFGPAVGYVYVCVCVCVCIKCETRIFFPRWLPSFLTISQEKISLFPTIWYIMLIFY